ncbi:MAG TPA: sigma-70 family RNA polymerase sigma factor [Vicinamibacterales bacterium]|nr:sigma-70 family RNA polymerase sigma factor [Vicinamibacterales bacterium]
MDFHQIYQAHASAVHRFAVGLTGDRALADDLTEDAFVRLWTASDEIRLPTVRAYLCTIVRNLHVSHLRKARRSTPLDDSLADPVDRVAAPLELRSQAEAALRALATLSPDDRETLLMRAADMSYAEIAQSLNISVTAAKVRVHRARVRALRAREEQSCK